MYQYNLCENSIWVQQSTFAETQTAGGPRTDAMIINYREWEFSSNLPCSNNWNVVLINILLLVN